MAKEDSIAELEHDIRTLEEKLSELTSAEEPNFGEITKLQDLLDEKENALEELTTEMAQNSGVDFEKAQKDEIENQDYEEEERVRQEEETKRIQEIEMEEREKEELAAREEEEKEELEREQEKEQEQEQEQEQEISSDGETRHTLTDWQLKTGIDIIPDEYIQQKYGKHLTEQEFKDILRNENVPKVIKEPGAAENYLKSADDWDNVRTSISALEQAIRSGNFPVDVNDASYILLEYDKDTIQDEHEDKDEDGYGKIDEEDIYGAIDQEEREKEEEKKLRDYIEQDAENDSLLSELQAYVLKGMLAVRAKAALELAKEAMKEIGSASIKSMSAAAPLVASLAARGCDFAVDVGKSAFEKIKRTLENDLENPVPPLENDMDEKEEEWEPQPGMPRPNSF